MADALKAEGNKAFAAKDYDRAINLFSKALDIDQSNFVIWSNRSAAKAGKRDWDGALADADQVSTHPPLHVAHNKTQNNIIVFARRARSASR
jgi:tetratricopeptide (TPR) repeat protein